MQFNKRKKKAQPRIDRPHVADKAWKVAAAHGRVTTLERDHMGLQQMATPRAGDNRVAAQMDGRHVHNKQPPTPSAHFTFVKWAAPLWRWMGSAASTRRFIWQRNLLLGLLGSGYEGSKACVHQPDMDLDHGRLA